MADEVNLSLEETNVIRRQLGLKPIEPEFKSEQKKPHVQQRKKEPRGAKIDDGLQFMDGDKVASLRKRLASLKNNSTVNGSEQDDEDWLNKIGTKKRHKPIKVIHEDEPEDESQSLKVSHGINELDSKNGVVLTLKEQSIDDENDSNDILENSELAQSQRDLQNVRLRKLNKHRKFKPLQLSSFELEHDEQSAGKNDSVVVVGGENKIEEEQDPTPNDTTHGKTKVEFNEDNGSEDDESPTDFQPIKIKKRSKRDVKSRVKLPSEIQPVQLVDEDEGFEEMQEPIAVASRPLLKHKMQTPQEIAQQIQREKLERQERSLNLSQLNKNSNLVIDENVQFLESLKANIVRPDKGEEQEQTREQGALSREQEGKVEQSFSILERTETPDFSTGLASTLHFLREKDLLSSNDVSQGYNPEINLVYKDERGIPLTTKEAYKKLSQKFHGTKSSKRTREKFESKLQARRSQESNTTEREFEL